MSEEEDRLIANLGDVNPIEHGGFFVFQTESGLELELLKCPEDPDSDDSQWEVYRFECPDDPESEWFWVKLPEVARCFGVTLDEIRSDLRSPDPITRSAAMQSLAEYFGPHKFDHYPLILGYDEVCERYSDLGFASQISGSMRPEIVHGSDWIRVESSCGGFLIPDDLVTDRCEAYFRAADRGTEAAELFLRTAAESIADYLECDPHDVSDLERVEGVFARLSMPGYLDCTEWYGPFDSLKEAYDDLASRFGE